MKFWMVWLCVLMVPAIAYVGIRAAMARRRGEDASAASVRALGEALPVVGAGVAGLLICLALFGIAAFLLFLLFLLSLGDNDTSGLTSSLVALLVLGGLALIGLPATALILVIRHRRRRGDRR